MKSLKIFCVLAAAMLAGAGAFAQETTQSNSQSGESAVLSEESETQSCAFMNFRRGSFYIGENRVPSAELRSYFGDFDYENLYLGAKKQRTAGTALISIGAPVAVTGIVFIIGSFTWSRDSVVSFSGGTLCLCSGVICLTTGIPLLCIGTSNMRRLANNYNAYKTAGNPACRPNLSLTGCRNGLGLGLALNF